MVRFIAAPLVGSLVAVALVATGCGDGRRARDDAGDAAGGDGGAGDAQAEDADHDGSHGDDGAPEAGDARDEPVGDGDIDEWDGSPGTLCVEGDDSEEEDGYDLRTRVSGTNGTFVDDCDDDGNLLERSCETEMVCDGPPPNPGCWSVQTGEVTSTTIDCDGRCEDGACYARCPDYGDLLEYVSIDAEGNVVVDNLTADRRYACDYHWDNPRDEIDCATDIAPGHRAEIESLGLRAGSCTGGTWGNIGTAACTYVDCRYVY